MLTNPPVPYDFCIGDPISRLNGFLNVKTVVAAFNQEKALVGAFSVITNLRMELFEALVTIAAKLPTSGKTIWPRDQATHATQMTKPRLLMSEISQRMFIGDWNSGNMPNAAATWSCVT